MKKYLLSTIAVLTALTVGTAANAQMSNSMSHMYLRADAGWSIGASETEEAAVFDIGVGSRLNQYFRTELVGEVRPWGKQTFKDNHVKVAKPDMYSLDAMMNVALEYPVWNKMSVYAIGGIGYAYNKTDSYRGLYKGEGKHNFAWNVGAGVQYALTNCISLDLGYRFADLGSARAKNVETGAKIKEDVKYNDIKIGMQYFF
jgi:opacity protein-like surface antigen